MGFISSWVFSVLIFFPNKFFDLRWKDRGFKVLHLDNFWFRQTTLKCWALLVVNNATHAWFFFYCSYSNCCPSHLICWLCYIMLFALNGNERWGHSLTLVGSHSLTLVGKKIRCLTGCMHSPPSHIHGSCNVKEKAFHTTTVTVDSELSPIRYLWFVTSLPSLSVGAGSTCDSLLFSLCGDSRLEFSLHSLLLTWIFLWLLELLFLYM